jgi:DNA-binding CsgD family transcriptional regulator
MAQSCIALVVKASPSIDGCVRGGDRTKVLIPLSRVFSLGSREKKSYICREMPAPRPDAAGIASNRTIAISRTCRDRGSALSGRGLLKLQSALTSEEFWEAAQVLIEDAAPSPSRWLCLRPIRMATALRLLRETRSPREVARFGNGNGADEDAASDREEAALLKELFARHPAISYFRSNPLVPVVHLRPLTKGNRNHVGFVRRRQWHFGAALAFWNKAQMEGLLLLHRPDFAGDYTVSELERLRQLHPQLEKALCRIITRRCQEAEKKALASILKPLPLPLVLCDWRLRIVCETAEGLEARTAWEVGEDRAHVLNPSPKRKLPPELAEFCRIKVTAWEEAGPRLRALLEKGECELCHPHQPHLRVHLRLLREKTFPMIKPLFLLRFETRPADGGRRQIRADNLASLTQLSAAERELALLVCYGHSNGAVARRLGKSVYTVKAQLHSIFGKLKVKSRSQLIAFLLIGLANSFVSSDLADSFFNGF